jgi:prepilin-type N-terminal cleavage/methylation domain-containing protein
MRKSRKGGFTLVELMIVAIIVAVLAAVAIPLMSGSKKRAMATEAEAGLGTVRSALRAMYAESADYTKRPGTTDLLVGMVLTNVPGIGTKDLEGTFWQTACYKVQAVAQNAFTIEAKNSTNASLLGVSVTLNDAGQFKRTGY